MNGEPAGCLWEILIMKSMDLKANTGWVWDFEIRGNQLKKARHNKKMEGTDIKTEIFQSCWLSIYL